MITCYLLNGDFSPRQAEDLQEIHDTVERERLDLARIPLPAIIRLLSSLGREMLKDPGIREIPGAPYISLWLRRENLDRLCTLNYANPAYLDGFRQAGPSLFIRAQPRGVVCHWIAGNIPTLAVFSAVQAVLSKNGSILKVPPENAGILLTFLRILDSIEVEDGGTMYRGREVVKSIAVISFDGRDHRLSSMLSLTADARVIYGGSEAVRAILALPVRDHCDTLVFGPRYSFGVFDREFIESDRFDDALRNAAQDVVLFNQMACSSPHVFFFEKSRYPLREIALALERHFRNLPAKFLEQPVSTWQATRILNARAVHLLSEGTGVVQSEDLGYTILMNPERGLEEPVQGRCIFLKEVDSIDDTLDLITRKIQAVSIGIRDREKREEFAGKATFRGAERIVVHGRIHDFDLPWDGMFTLNRLVRWVILKHEPGGEKSAEG